MKIIILTLLATAIIVNANLKTRAHQSQDHQLLSNQWVGTSDSACDQACGATYGKVCGTFTKICCRVDCDRPHWWSGWGCSDSNNVISLNCSVLQSLTGGWRDNSCDASCLAQKGKVCGTNLKQCCKDGCDVGSVFTTCLNSNAITTGLTCV